MKTLDKNKKIIGWGVDLTFSKCMEVSSLDIEYLVDNNQNKQNSYFEDYFIYPPSKLLNESKNEIVVIVFSYQYKEMAEQLESMGFEWGVNAFSFLQLYEYKDVDELIITHKKDFLFLNEIVKEGWTCLDIGASYGLYSKKLSKLVGSGGSVYSFEPQPYPFSGLIELINDYSLNNVKALNIALTNNDLDSELKMRIPSKNGISISGMGLISTGLQHDLQNDFYEKNEISIVSKTFDSIISEHKIEKINFMKIDVEGYEIHVLNGALKTISINKPILQIEIAFNYHVNDSFNQVNNLLSSYGYKPFILNQGKLELLHKPEVVSGEIDYYFIVI